MKFDFLLEAEQVIVEVRPVYASIACYIYNFRTSISMFFEKPSYIFIAILDCFRLKICQMLMSCPISALIEKTVQN